MGHNAPTSVRPLDLSTMVARVLLALLTAATVVLFGLWLRASDALAFASTLISVTASQVIAASLRGKRVGPPTAAAQRLQPLLDAMADYPGGRVLGKRGFKRGVVALGVGLAVAIGSSVVSGLLFSQATMPPLWRSTIALGVVLLPMHLWLTWTRSAQEYTGTRFAARMLDALREVVRPGAAETGSASTWQPQSRTVRVPVVAVARTVLTLVLRVVTHLLIPALFSTPISIAAVALAVITWIAGAPVFAALGRSMVKPAAPAAPATQEVD